ncbi:MAG: VWA domain-containing protein [Parachlamydiaceae bacterium]|nr:VWA domain-containing protein [Parachlamydiaceae bacterium]
MDLDYSVLFLLVIFFLLIFFLKTKFFSNLNPPSLSFSKISPLKFSTWRIKCFSYSSYLHYFALTCLSIALINPKIISEKSPSIIQKESIRQLPKEGIAIYLVLDQSGSMSRTMADDENLKKIEFLKQVTKQFIVDHPNDLMGLIAFARIPRVLVPLTLDQKTLLKKLDDLQVVSKPEDDGTAIGYGIYKTANLMAATRYFSEEVKNQETLSFTIKSSVMIVVSDGFQDPNRLDYGNRLRTIELDEAAEFAKKENIHLYMINIDPSFASDSYAPHRRQLERITRETGGQFYLIKNPKDLKNIYQSIHKLEKGVISQDVLSPQSTSTTIYYFYPYLIFLGLIGLLTALILETWILKTVP